MIHDIDDEMLSNAINNWEATAPIELLLDIKALNEHMTKENGIRLGFTGGLRNTVVVDEKKYTMFLLRWS